MLQIRLLRVGKKHKPSFRLILVQKGKRPGKYLEYMGAYSPLKKEKKAENIETERINYWLSKGVQLTPTVRNILISAGVIAGKKTKIKISKGKKAASASGGFVESGKSEAKPAEVLTPLTDSTSSVENTQDKSPQANSGQEAEEKPASSIAAGQAAEVKKK